jgi:hypothetical protein
MSNAGLKGGQGGQQVVEMSAAKPWASVESSSGKEAGGIKFNKSNYLNKNGTPSDRK